MSAYRDALLERTRDRVPLRWATTQNNLGNALQALGKRESGTARLEEAMSAYRNALLEIVIPAAHIFRWVTTEEIAEAVALLVSDRGKFIAGVIYRVDGGMTGA